MDMLDSQMLHCEKGRSQAEGCPKKTEQDAVKDMKSSVVPQDDT